MASTTTTSTVTLPQPLVERQVTTAPTNNMSWLWIILLLVVLIAALVLAIVALVIALQAKSNTKTLTTNTNASIASLQAQINAISTGGSTGISQSVRYSGGVGSTDPSQAIVPAGSNILFHQQTAQTADITYDDTTGVFTVANAGLYSIAFDAPVVLTANVDGSGEMEAYISVGPFSATSVKYGEIRVAVPDSFAIPALPAWPIATSTEVRLAAGDTFSCVIGLFGASAGLIPGVGATAPLNVNASQCNFSCSRVRA